MSENKSKKRFNSPYWLVFTIFGLLATAIVYNMVRISIIEAPEWNKKAKEMLHLDTLHNVAPQRGDILAHDGTPLAQTVALYTVSIDFKDPGLDPYLYVNTIHPEGSPLPDTLNLDTLCEYLATHYPVRTKAEYAAYISQRRDSLHYCELIKDIDVSQLNDLKALSIFKHKTKGKNTGLVSSRVYKRLYPFDSLTSVVLGRASLVTAEMLEKDSTYQRNEWHGTSGLERGLEDVLFGTRGSSENRQRHWGFSQYVVIPPVPGKDVITTLDLTMQEIAERNLMEMVSKQHASYGTAIIMDVATGEIRAMANVDKNRKGKYTFKTSRNYAVTAIEPGSVIKTLSMAVALEKLGNIDVHRKFDSHGAVPEIRGFKALKAYEDIISPHRVIVRSDNRGICKMITDIYRPNYNNFIEDVRETQIIKTGYLKELPGSMNPIINKLKLHPDTPHHFYSFAQAVFGYHSLISPLSTLSVYNAIANNGRLMQPQIVKGLMVNGEIDTIYAPICLNEQLCTPTHVQQLREMLYGVVYEDGGTAIRIRGGRVKIAGKTGTVTAQQEFEWKDSEGNIRHGVRYLEGEYRLAFAGFFPYDNPQYSCIVVVDKPRDHSAGGVAGGVFRAIAEEMYSRNLLSSDVDYRPISANKNIPQTKSTTQYDEAVYRYLNQYPLPDSNRVEVEHPSDNPNEIPSVLGYTAKDAMFILEQYGIEVEIIGMGRVENQSLAAGTPILPGMKITLMLK